MITDAELMTIREAIDLADNRASAHPGSRLNDLGQCQETALRQAERIRKYDARVRALIAERDAARADADHARLVAAGYAECLGLDDAEHVATLEHERRLLTHYDRRNHALERAWSGVLALRHEMAEGVRKRGWHPTPEELDRALEEIGRLAEQAGVQSSRPGPRELKQVRRVFDTPD